MGVLVENRTQSLDTFVLFSNLPFQGTAVSSTVDTEAHIRGVTFIPFVAFVIPFGESWTFLINESDDSGMANSNVIEDARLTAPINSMSISSPSNTGDILKAVGVFNTKRYINITATNVVGGGAGLNVLARAILNEQPR